MSRLIDFTIRSIEAIKAPEAGRDEYRDSKAAGLYLRVMASGVKTFSFVGRAKGSHRVERVTIGKFPVVKPEEARRRATEIAGQLAGGTSAAAAGRERRGELTLKELYDLYLERLRRTAKRPEYVETLWDLYIGPDMGTRRLSEISALLVERWHHALPARILKRRADAAAVRHAEKDARRAAIAAKQAVRRRGPDPKPKPDLSKQVTAKVTGKRTANMAVELVRAMFNFALAPKQRYFAGVNPASKAFMFKNNERDRFLQPGELGPFFAALADEPNEGMRDFILIALLTAMRKANLAAMRWEEIDFETSQWRVAGHLMKNGDPHIVPLGPEAVAILEQRKEATGNSPFVFPSSRSKSGHISDVKSAWTRVMRQSDLGNLRPHDLRRTLGSWQAKTGASLVLIGKSLAHKDPQSTAVYARLDLDPVRQSMGRATSAMFEAAGFKPAAEVIDISARKPAAKRRTPTDAAAGGKKR